jgi:hypothetical protein
MIIFLFLFVFSHIGSLMIGVYYLYSDHESEYIKRHFWGSEVSGRKLTCYKYSIGRDKSQGFAMV